MGFPSFRRYVEFFSFLKRYWRPYAVDREGAEPFVYVTALVYNSLIYTFVPSRVPDQELTT